MNEIKILTCLRHPNLVSLYGCTSRRSRELLLVYEYIPNGTVADHLHGEKAKESPLAWPVRMNIAIETASALAYLHKKDIIHRDVKTNNILLDNNFCVKVADFGLSRLFPNDVTHVSTAPQGTPGYVDPEYHQCYQLTDKSDVYSFGVFLIELISSMPAVDITRHRHEINLANLAVNRIQRCAFDELIDSSLGYNSDGEVTRMTTSVAELALRCLQLEKDLRPSMEEVLDTLKDIQAGEDCKFEKIEGANSTFNMQRKIPSSPESDDAMLLKNKRFQSSPVAVTDVWASSGSTTASSIG
ncbi:Tyrosine kinase [Handroanthus impetiginosus]|uniref:Tyrosine kinase n=1 Tax=Handroanthus impetiginosus TaxID=429701 RepID=A0A2G9H787_9LAMI|nr:Tyrosine kinase [Handroanthus impetiginosus]